jgi:DedD protein
MARRRSRGDRILESRHLIGLFVGVVILCSVFFSLGYVMGRSHYSGAVQAAYAPGRSAIPATDREADRETDQSKEDTLAPAGEWDFYANQNNNKLEKPAVATKDSTPETPSIAADRPPDAPLFAPVRAPRRASRATGFTPPKMLGNNMVLQIAAVTHQSDALAMADALQRKRFPSFVVAPAADGFYRVQVGPYPDERSAENAKTALDRAGFKAIIKH